LPEKLEATQLIYAVLISEAGKQPGAGRRSASPNDGFGLICAIHGAMLE